MIQMLKFMLAYYRLYRYKTKQNKLHNTLQILMGKETALQMAINLNFANEKELFEKISKANKKLAGKRLIEFKKDSLKKSREITEKVAKAAIEFEKNTERVVDNGMHYFKPKE